MYWEVVVRLLNKKKIFLQESLLLQHIMILIIFFCNLKNLYTV